MRERQIRSDQSFLSGFHLHTFEAAGVLKFRYNGRVYFNPDVRDVAAEFRRDADISYKMFMSD